MATQENLQYLLRQMASNYGYHPQWIADVLEVWTPVFSNTSDKMLTEAVNQCLDECEKFPNVAQIRKKLAELRGGPTKTVEKRPEGCEDCSGTGRREIAWHYVVKAPGERYNIQTSTAFCTCEAGQFYHQGDKIKQLQYVIDRLNGFAETVGVFVTDRKTPYLTPQQLGYTLNPNPEARAKDWRALMGTPDPANERKRLRIIQNAKQSGFEAGFDVEVEYAQHR